MLRIGLHNKRNRSKAKKVFSPNNFEYSAWMQPISLSYQK